MQRDWVWCYLGTIIELSAFRNPLDGARMFSDHINHIKLERLSRVLDFGAVDSDFFQHASQLRKRVKGLNHIVLDCIVLDYITLH